MCVFTSYVCTHVCVLSVHNKDTHGHVERCEVELYLVETEESLARLNTETRFRKNSHPEYMWDSCEILPVSWPKFEGAQNPSHGRWEGRANMCHHEAPVCHLSLFSLRGRFLTEYGPLSSVSDSSPHPGIRDSVEDTCL